ncbi:MULTISPECIES: flagellar assembly protein FliW [Virgibacillus]|uniref:Flagellar assembly factor FliW n=2 Tax=Virgibacillus TaxID=84406 RepID=A0A024Q966_9BACI|nr:MULTISPECIES: flagellar assembly protein FliW [Virgibacillus]EQB37478.1 hypothetical protein M948_02735 [Virgibacillus sp. CM-4]MYL40230.1 flagellar assembly protein FliW [Virgibacillus massiliensis]GGJ60617.1 flagellar assembly factor FliW [Virgibacillus kapii]CDQ39004.1 Flagellar assembly factor FliW [Virgibacillus massiliensis]
MLVDTKYFGQTEIDPAHVIVFQNGIPGFNQDNQFILLDFPDHSLFQILQSIDTRDTAFFVINPYSLFHHYEFRLDDSSIETLQLSNEEDIVVLSIVTLKRPFATSTVNLKAPIIINSKRNLGKQYIINAVEYPSRAPITTNDPSKVKGESSC